MNKDVIEAIKMEKAIDGYKSKLVKEAEDIIQNKQISEKDGLKESQFRNLMNVATQTQSVDVVTNFIKYQIGRSKKSKEWQFHNFGEELIKIINSLQDKACNIYPDNKNETWIKITRLLIGFMIRYFKYKKCDKE